MEPCMQPAKWDPALYFPRGFPRYTARCCSNRSIQNKGFMSFSALVASLKRLLQNQEPCTSISMETSAGDVTQPVATTTHMVSTTLNTQETLGTSPLRRGKSVHWLNQMLRCLEACLCLEGRWWSTKRWTTWGVAETPEACCMAMQAVGWHAASSGCPPPAFGRFNICVLQGSSGGARPNTWECCSPQNLSQYLNRFPQRYKKTTSNCLLTVEITVFYR